jgi:hypothetical protein
MLEHRDLPYPEPEDFGLSSRHGLVSVIVFVRHRPADELRVTVVWSDAVSSLESDRTVVFELRDPNGGVVDRGEDYALQRQRDDGGWQPVPREGIVLMPGYFLEPGTSRALKLLVPRRASPGHHRVVLEVGAASTGNVVRPTVEFDVVARTSE